MIRIVLLILLPTLAGCVALTWSSRVGRRIMLISVALAHLVLTTSLWLDRPAFDPHDWMAIDGVGLLFLSIISILFLASSVYTVGYLAQEYRIGHVDAQEGFMFRTSPSAVFTGCLMLFLGAMTGVTVSQHLGLLWVFMEATTLASAPLIYFHRHHRSLEATWKYLLICSVGIALALLGNFLLAVSAFGGPEEHAPLTLSALIENATHLNPQWLKAAMLFLLVGYGTKMGLAPMHTALPDADSEAPPAVAALLSGALLNCAFLGIFRAHQICVAAGLGSFSGQLFLVFGLISMVVAAVFIVRQNDFRRMLAYSGIEHMGILAIGVGLGAAGTFGALLHAFNHSFTKAALFYVSGNIFTAYDSKFVSDVSGVRRVLPISGVLWILGFLAITGAPPFGAFLSEFTILRAAFAQQSYVVAGVYLALLALIFIGMANIVLPMAQGEPSEPRRAGVRSREPLWSVVPPAVLMALVLWLGLWIPQNLFTTLDEVAQTVKAPADTSLADIATPARAVVRSE